MEDFMEELAIFWAIIWFFQNFRILVMSKLGFLIFDNHDHMSKLGILFFDNHGFMSKLSNLILIIIIICRN
jgi:hypothetical protein